MHSQCALFLFCFLWALVLPSYSMKISEFISVCTRSWKNNFTSTIRPDLEMKIWFYLLTKCNQTKIHTQQTQKWASILSSFSSRRKDSTLVELVHRGCPCVAGSVLCSLSCSSQHITPSSVSQWLPSKQLDIGRAAVAQTKNKQNMLFMFLY